MFEFYEGSLEDLERLLQLHDMLQKCFHWSPPPTASARRSFETKFRASPVSWREGSHEYSAKPSLFCSAANIYYKAVFEVDGRRTNVTTIRNSFKRMSEADARQKYADLEKELKEREI